MKNKRGLLAALRTNPENLSVEKLKKRDAYLNQQPAIAAIYHFKRRLHRLLMKKPCLSLAVSGISLCSYEWLLL